MARFLYAAKDEPRRNSSIGCTNFGRHPRPAGGRYGRDPAAASKRGANASSNRLRADGYVRPQDLHRPRPPKRRPWRRNAPRGRGWWRRTRRPEVRCFALKHDIALFGVSTTANPDKTWRGVPDATHRLSPSCANNPNLLSLSAMGIGRQCTTRRLATRGTDRELS
jgi:hypothetical protein